MANKLKLILQTDDVAILIEASHLCVSSRGIKDTDSGTVTAEYGGVFLEPERSDEFLKYLNPK